MFCHRKALFILVLKNISSSTICFRPDFDYLGNMQKNVFQKRSSNRPNPRLAVMRLQTELESYLPPLTQSESLDIWKKLVIVEDNNRHSPPGTIYRNYLVIRIRFAEDSYGMTASRRDAIIWRKDD